MAKGTWVEASKDDPIYKGGFVISSVNSSRGSMKSTETSQSDTDGPSTATSTPPTEEPTT